MKQRFVEDLVLAHFDPTLDTQVEPDASGWATSGVLNQFDPKIQAWRPVAFYSSRHGAVNLEGSQSLLPSSPTIRTWSLL
jgi:hypothetical protein